MKRTVQLRNAASGETRSGNSLASVIKRRAKRRERNPECLSRHLFDHLVSAKQQRLRNSVLVWTDTEGHVVDYGAALQGGVLPPYATGLVDANELDLRRLLYPAAQGFSVIAAKKIYALKIRNTNRGCVPSAGG
jgi:hypothetical protein